VGDDVLAQATDALDTSGARILTTVSASALLVSDDPAVRQQLAEILGRPAAAPDELPGLAAAEVASRLTVSGPQAPDEDVLTQLLSGGFLAPVGAPPNAATLEEIGAPGQVVLVLSGSEAEDPALPPEAFARLTAPGVRAIRARAAADWHDATPAEMTIPSTIAEEHATNPFMRAKNAADLGRLRAMKDGF